MKNSIFVSILAAPEKVRVDMQLSKGSKLNSKIDIDQ